MRTFALAAFLAGGCASLPPTSLPICEPILPLTNLEGYRRLANVPGGPIPEELCISSVRAERDYAWEAVHACTWPPETRHAPCYVHAGARDGRQVYRLRWYSSKPARGDKHSGMPAPTFVVLFETYDSKGYDALEAKGFATVEETEEWLNGCEPIAQRHPSGERKVNEDGTFKDETCAVQFIPGTDTGVLVGVYEIGKPIAGGFELTGQTDPAEDDFAPRWRLR